MIESNGMLMIESLAQSVEETTPATMDEQVAMPMVGETTASCPAAIALPDESEPVPFVPPSQEVPMEPLPDNVMDMVALPDPASSDHEDDGNSFFAQASLKILYLYKTISLCRYWFASRFERCL